MLRQSGRQGTGPAAVVTAPTLRLTDVSTRDVNAVEIEFELPGEARRSKTIEVEFELSAADREGLRWYYEDFLQFPAEPAPSIAARIETRSAEIGKELFAKVFGSDDDAREIWTDARRRLSETRVEVVGDVGESAMIPWELLWDPRTDVPVAISAAAFVRGYANPAQRPQLPALGSEPVRILLAICRPAGGEDVPFRSVASRLIKGLGDLHRADFELDILRPPTFARLGEVLRVAAEEQPYHIVHFDGHGVYGEIEDGGPKGYLLFESDSPTELVERVDGTQLGSLLSEARVPVLVLNACRSARSAPAEVPASSEPGGAHARVRAFGSLALEVMDAGVAGVVAMQYNVYVVTAAHFVGDLYATLARGQSLGRAVSLGRKQLRSQPRRDLIGAELELQDWPVPVVYEAAPVTLFAEAEDDPLASIELDEAGATPDRGTVDPTLPQPPDVGFFGRDETLLALDRAFDSQRVVLLHAFAGSGKTATAAEFARWYSLTGGIEGPILFTSFERYTPLVRVVDDFNRVFAAALEGQGIHWLALSDTQRIQLTRDVLKRVPVLWIWDNVETVRGLGDTGESPWTVDEQRELFEFLQALRETKCRVLLTSRREERDWLGEVPGRVALPAMPIQERVQLARALALRQGKRIHSLEGWRPLLEFTRGNPLTITVVVGEALRQGLETPDEIGRYVDELRRGETSLSDDPAAGRARSLSASLSYGFREAFDDTDRKRLALLHLFEQTIVATVFAAMGNLGAEPVPELAGMTDEEAIRLLDRSAEIGHLTSLGGGVYAVHPALPGYFKEIFDEHYVGAAKVRALRAFCNAVGGFGAFVGNALEAGEESAAAILAVLEPDLLSAQRVARANGWGDLEITAMEGLGKLYDRQGRWAEWSRLVEEVAPDFVHPETGGPIEGRFEEWYTVAQFRVRIAFERADFAEAARLQQLLVDSVEREAGDALTKPVEELNDDDRMRLISVSIALMELGMAEYEQQRDESIVTLERSLDVARRAGSSDQAAKVGYNLAVAYLALPSVRDLDRAEELLVQTLESLPDSDYLWRSMCYGELGFIALQHAEDAVVAGDGAAAGQFFAVSIGMYEHALELTPPDAAKSLAKKHMNVGTLHLRVGNDEAARTHFQQSIHYAEASSDAYAAGLSRFKIAHLFWQSDRPAEARLYATAALKDLENLGQEVEPRRHEIRDFLAALE